MSHYQRVLVVYKKSAYQLYILERHDPHLARLLRQGHPDVLDMRSAHEVHQATLSSVVKSLQRLGVPYRLLYRARLRTASPQHLVVSVGGDGTLLEVSHLVEDAPVLGVNSDPQRSEAVFCAATRETFERLLRRALVGQLRALCVYRLRVRLNGRVVGPRVLNDVLIANDDPARMSRYRLTMRSHSEDHKSSGLWVATAAGSSSAIAAAGGKHLAWTAKQFQYRPRELYEGRLNRYRFTGGMLAMGERLQVTWLMRDGFACIDGPHVRHPLRFGDRLVVTLSPTHPLRVLGLHQS